MFALLLLPPELTSPSATTYILCIFCDQHPLEVRSRVPMMRYPGSRGRRKWRPKEEMGGNGRAREGER